MNKVMESLLREIEERGVVSFARFMELALYLPGAGYYEKPREPGRHGDFVTSVSVGSLFGELLSRQFAAWLDELGPAARSNPSSQILEAGAHAGRLAHDILCELQRSTPGCFSSIEYWILEPSIERRNWQAETLREFTGKVRWFHDWDDLPPEGVRGIIFSNELLDAMPAHRMAWDALNKTWIEWGVGREGDQFVWEPLPKSSVWAELRKLPVSAACGELLWPSVPEQLLDLLPYGFTTEISPSSLRWWANAAGALNAGTLMTIDYGFGGEEFFRPERLQGTLRAYHEHRATEDVLSSPGERDITAHVNFTALECVGKAAGLQTIAFEPQSKFLTGIFERLCASGSPPENWSSARTRQFQTLTHPEHFGRAFRVLVQSRT
jgi:SAM-dependent MidA family methyltransferase